MLKRLCEDARQHGVEGLVNRPCFEHFAEEGRTCVCCSLCICVVSRAKVPRKILWCPGPVLRL
jgi:hypothetical protein